MGPNILYVLASDLIAIYPNVYHTADARAWGSIRAHGLMPTSMLHRLVGAEQEGRRLDVAAYQVPGSEGDDVVVIRDQRPLKYLDQVVHDDTTPGDFLRILDERCFFWVSEERLLRLLMGRNYRHTPQVVLTVDTASLVATYGEIIELSPYNSGSAHVPNAPRRGRSTFQTIADYDFEGWRKKRGRAGDALVELTVPGSIPDLLDHVVKVRHFPSDFTS